MMISRGRILASLALVILVMGIIGCAPAATTQLMRATNVSVEAESMALTNYVVNSNTSASGGNLIKLSGSGVTGSATYNFTGSTGTYDIKVYYYDENDGACTFRIYVGGVKVDEWVANQNLGSADPVAATRTSRTKAGVTINNGDQIRLEAVQNSQEWGRYDNVDFIAGGSPPPSGGIAINAGGPAVSPFVADAYYSGGTAATNWTGAIDLSAVTNPAPEAVYQTERWGTMTYTIPGFMAGSSNTVRLHFCENYYNTIGARKFNVAINGTSKLTNYDILSTAGAIHKANIKEFTVNANSSGQYIIAFTTGAAGSPLVNGIEIVGGTSSQPPTVSITSPANGATFSAPASITINANASDADGSVTKVEFFQGATKLGEDTLSPYSYTWSNVAAGSYSLTAKATDNAGAVTTSSAVNITVKASSTARWLGEDGSSLAVFNSLVGGHAQVHLSFAGWTWNQNFSSCATAITNDAADGGITMWSMQAEVTNAEIIGGTHDAYLHTWAHDAATDGRKFLLRFNHEMNGDWYAWGYGSGHLGNTPQSYAQAWKHVHDIFVTEGATNVKWVFCPNTGYTEQGAYPGDAYVDYVAIDGYNWGTTQTWSHWQTFTEIFQSTYNVLTGLTNKPIFVGETSCFEQGGNKANWITSAFLTEIPSTMPKFIGVVWFNEGSFVINTSQAALDAYKNVVRDPGWQGTFALN